MNFNNLYKQLLVLKEATEEPSQRTLRIGTLFSGMGAPEIALNQLGIDYKVVFASEIDKNAQAFYRHLHNDKFEDSTNGLIPNVYNVIPELKDRNIGVESDLDLIIAGFSCQAFSTSGKGYKTNSVKVQVGNKQQVVHKINNFSILGIDDDYIIQQPAIGRIKPKEVNLKDGISTKIISALRELAAQNKLTSEQYKFKSKLEGAHYTWGIFKNGTGNESTQIKGSDGEPTGEYDNQRITISPDSDGLLARETLRIINYAKPKVAILENVSAFGLAENEIGAMEFDELFEAFEPIYAADSIHRGKSGYANINKGLSRKTKVAPGREQMAASLVRVLNQIGYYSLPLYLNPPTFVKNAVGNRPRFYLVAIRRDLVSHLEPKELDSLNTYEYGKSIIDKTITGELQGLNDNIVTNNQTNWATNMPNMISEIVKYGGKTVEQLHAPADKTFLQAIANNFRKNNLANITQNIIDSLFESGHISEPQLSKPKWDISINLQRQIEYLLSAKDIETNKNLVGYKNSVKYALPFLIDAKAQIDFSKRRAAQSNLDSVITSIIENTCNQIDLKQLYSTIVGSAPQEPSITNEDYFIKICLQDFLKESVDNTNINYENSLNTLRGFIIKTILVKWTTWLMGRAKTIFGTILTSTAAPRESVLQVSGQAMGIYRTNNGEIYYGYYNSRIAARLMQIFEKEGTDDVYEKLKSTTFDNKRNPKATEAKIMARIGNSMNVGVLVRLFKGIKDLGIWN